MGKHTRGHYLVVFIATIFVTGVVDLALSFALGLPRTDSGFIVTVAFYTAVLVALGHLAAKAKGE